METFPLSRTTPRPDSRYRSLKPLPSRNVQIKEETRREGVGEERGEKRLKVRSRVEPVVGSPSERTEGVPWVRTVRLQTEGTSTTEQGRRDVRRSLVVPGLGDEVAVPPRVVHSRLTPLLLTTRTYWHPGPTRRSLRCLDLGDPLGRIQPTRPGSRWVYGVLGAAAETPYPPLPFPPLTPGT